MVDTTDSKSVASNRVRVQVSSPVYDASRIGKRFVFNLSLMARLELGSLDKSRSAPIIDNPKQTAGALCF